MNRSITITKKTVLCIGEKGGFTGYPGAPRLWSPISSSLCSKSAQRSNYFDFNLPLLKFCSLEWDCVKGTTVLAGISCWDRFKGDINAGLCHTAVNLNNLMWPMWITVSWHAMLPRAGGEVRTAEEGGQHQTVTWETWKEQGGDHSLNLGSKLT